MIGLYSSIPDFIQAFINDQAIDTRFESEIRRIYEFNFVAWGFPYLKRGFTGS